MSTLVHSFSERELRGIQMLLCSEPKKSQRCLGILLKDAENKLPVGTAPSGARECHFTNPWDGGIFNLNEASRGDIEHFGPEAVSQHTLTVMAIQARSLFH